MKRLECPFDSRIAIQKEHTDQYILIMHHDVKVYKRFEMAEKFLCDHKQHFNNMLKSGKLDFNDIKTMNDNLDCIAWQLSALNQLCMESLK